MAKKVLLTGAEGFIGSHLCEALVREGYQVRAFILYNSFSFQGWLESLPPEIRPEIEVISADIRDSQAVSQALMGVDWVFHLAALISIPYSFQAVESFIDVNIKGTHNVLQAALRHAPEKILITSTSEVYGTAQYVPIDEAHPLQSQSPYSASKIGADYLALSFRHSFSLPLSIVRPFNAYGPRQSARAVIPTIMLQLLAGAEEIQLGELRSTRDFTYIKDTVRAFLAIAQATQTEGEVINIASAYEISIGELADTLISLINPGARVVLDPQRIRPGTSEVFRLFGSHAKLTSLTGWEPSYSLRQGLAETLDWFSDKDNLSLYKALIYNV